MAQMVLILNEQLAKVLALPKTAGETPLASASPVRTHRFERRYVVYYVAWFQKEDLTRSPFLCSCRFHTFCV